MTVKISKEPTNFRIKYILRPFCALKGKGTKNPATERVEEKWPEEFTGDLLATNFTDFELPEMSRSYSGRIALKVERLESSGYVVEHELKTFLQPHPNGVHGHLPSAELDTKIILNDLGEELPPAQALISLCEDIDLIKITKVKQRRFRDALKLHREDKVVISEIPKNNLDKTSHLLEQLPALLGSQESSKSGEEEFWDLMEKVGPLMAELTQYEKNPERVYRSNLSTYLGWALRGDKDIPESRIVSGIDQELLKDLGKNLFEIFRHYMNVIVRFFRTQYQQTWIRKLEQTDMGYFYITNYVEMNGKGPFIPIAHHSVDLVKLPQEYMIQRNEWNDRIKPILGNTWHLQLVADRFQSFALQGIFSRAIETIHDGHLADAVILGDTGLEAAMRNVLDYFNVKRRNAPGLVTAVKKLVRKAEFYPKLPFDIDDLWRLIEGKPRSKKDKGRKYSGYEDGLIPERNKCAHGFHKYSIDPKRTKRIGEYIAAARTISQTLELWISQDPDKKLAKHA